MVSITDILNVLNNWKPWQRMREAPERIDRLEAEIAALKRAVTALPDDPRPMCGKCGRGRMAFENERADPTFGVMGGKQVTRKCETCGHVTTAQEMPR
jgi:ribosomal protein S27AE